MRIGSKGLSEFRTRCCCSKGVTRFAGSTLGWNDGISDNQSRWVSRNPAKSSPPKITGITCFGRVDRMIQLFIFFIEREGSPPAIAQAISMSPVEGDEAGSPTRLVNH